MPDWLDFVRSRLGTTGLSPTRQQEIVEELAGHLHDAETEGAFCDVEDWPALVRAIRLAEEDEMKTRLRTLWVPGLISGVLATLALQIVQHTGYQPQVKPSDLQPMVLYYPWFIALPVIGAIAALLSRRAGGAAKIRLLAAVFPSFGVLAMTCLLAPAAAIGTLYKGESLTYFGLLIAQFLGVWVLLPAAALAVGALPFVAGSKPVIPEDSATRVTA